MGIKIPINTSGVTDYIQSGYLHLMAAGSDASDNSSTGFHLRWNLLGNLGRKHLPKGTLSNSGTYATTIAYNRNNDYVAIARAAYIIDAYRTAVDFTTAIPDTVVDSGSTREWHFEGIIPVSVVSANINTIILLFSDISQYDYWAPTYDPSTDPLGFLQHYTGTIEAKVEDKLCFSVFITLGNASPGDPSILRSEGIAVPDTTDPTTKILSCRKTEMDGYASLVELRGENLESVRFSYSQFYPVGLSFQCYYDYILGVNESKSSTQWTSVGNFSLSITDAVTDARLENTSSFSIDQSWPRYAEANPTTGAYTVSVANYLDKWAPGGDPSSDEGILEVVRRYLDKSKTDVFALDSLESDTANDEAQYDISYLDALKLIGLDFHFARMLGLGTIDVPSDGTYVYAALFKCTKDPADETQTLSVHNIFMSLPTSGTDYRLPVAPYLKPLTYGLAVSNGTDSPTQLSDENGFALYDDVRFVNLDKDPYPYDQLLGAFYENANDFFSADVSKPVLFGVKYKGDEETVWRSPEISIDEDYLDAANIEEVVPFPETNGTLYMHMEVEEGIHDYAIYGINLFSRVSNLSNECATDGIPFPVRNTLLPPSNFQIQLIQSESTPILTTTLEQGMLAPISGTDKTLVRATFEWNEAQNIAYNVADKVDFYFCDHAPLTVRGVITSVSNSADNHAGVELGSLTITSSNPSETIQPTINSGDVSRFVGSYLAAGQQLFEIESVVTSGSTPILLIKKTKQTQSQEYPIGSNQFITTETYVAPLVGDMAMLVENMANTANWSTHLAKQVPIIDFTPAHNETVTLGDGSQKTLYYGGIYNTSAVIDQVYDLHDPGVATGIYKITFSSYSLPTHSDSDVSWYKGSVRVEPTVSSWGYKKLQVWNIQPVGSDLEITVFDPDFSTTPIVPLTDAQRTGVRVNFHPGYRVYLYKDNASGNNFTASAMLPSSGEGTKITYMGVRSMDSTLSPDIFSSISVPVPLIAREIVEPAVPLEMTGPLYATRPDVYGKSTYTFDAKIDTTGGRVPFGLIFFRGNDRLVLSTIYNPTTLAIVLAELDELTGDDALYYGQRIHDVISGTIDVSGTFKAYDTGTYVLPDPDNADLQIPDPADDDTLISPFDGSYTLSDLVTSSMLQNAIANAFLPLTEQPVIFRLLKPGTKTSPKKPLFKDENGQIIPPVLPTDPGYDANEYDPFPMAVTYTDSGDTYVRFTDYTLDGASKNIYFYYSVEFSNTNTFSDRCLLATAVRLVNTYPADAPQIRKVNTQLADPAQALETAVLFDINPYLPSDGIGEYLIYRAINSKDALNVRTMTLAHTISVVNPLIDDFSDVAFPLYGEVLYYRIVAVRITKDETGMELKVPSQPSNIAVTNVVDVINPPAPQLRSVNGTTTPTELQEVILKWPTVAYNATYKLQKQSDTGNWIELYSVTSNVAMQYPPLDQNSLPDFTNYPATELLERQDEDSNPIYHRFRVQVINSSGLLNLIEKPLTLATGCADLQALEQIVNYTDSNHSITPLSSQKIDEGVTNPLVMQFDNVLTELPAGHNTFVQTDVTVSDDLGHSYTQTITTINPTVTFFNNQGGLVLNTSNPNRTYTIQTLTTTDYCTNGALKTYTLSYITSPCNDLLQLTDLISLTDSSHTIPVLVNSDINDDISYPGSLTFIDISDPDSLGQTFDGMDIKVTDDYGHFYTLSIAANDPGGSVIFSHGDGGLILNSSDPNRSYTIEVTLFTDLCITGTKFTYTIAYTSTPCDQLESLTNLVSFADDNGSSFNPLSSQNVPMTHHAGGSMTFGDIVSSSLPSGHTFDRIDIILQDGLGATTMKSLAALSSVTFDNGDGGLVLNNGVENLTYTITVILYTDLCTIGSSFNYNISYLE